MSHQDERNKEYERGRRQGCAAALHTYKCHGMKRLQRDSIEMLVDARKKNADWFDRGYSMGYQDALNYAKGLEKNVLGQVSNVELQ